MDCVMIGHLKRIDYTVVEVCVAFALKAINGTLLYCHWAFGMLPRPILLNWEKIYWYNEDERNCKGMKQHQF